MRAVCFGFTSGLLALAALAPATFAQDEPPQFVAPPDTLPLEDEGTLEVYHSDFLQVRDSKMDIWILKILPATSISVTGQAEADYLRPGLSIQFDNELNKKGQFEQPIAEIELLPDKSTLGLFAADDDAEARPIRNPEPGAYRIRGKLAAVKQNQLTVSIGGRRYGGELAEDVKINFASDDPSVAEAGDAVKVKAWYYNNAKPISAMNVPGRAFAESISITLEKPLQPTGRRRK
ncbi:MAG: hypothetical protein WD845_18420 [Pirellulales bacterium]